MDRVTCSHIKRDGSICERVSTRITGCARHWKLYEKNMKKRPCLVCKFPTDADSGYCAKYCSKYSAKFHALNYRMRQKYGAKALQPSIPKAPISESDDRVGALRLIISEAPIFKPGDGVGTLQPRIHEALVSDSDDENMGPDLFED